MRCLLMATAPPLRPRRGSYYARRRGASRPALAPASPPAAGCRRRPPDGHARSPGAPERAGTEPGDGVAPVPVRWKSARRLDTDGSARRREMALTTTAALALGVCRCSQRDRPRRRRATRSLRSTMGFPTSRPSRPTPARRCCCSSGSGSRRASMSAPTPKASASARSPCSSCMADRSPWSPGLTFRSSGLRLGGIPRRGRLRRLPRRPQRLRVLARPMMDNACNATHGRAGAQASGGPQSWSRAPATGGGRARGRARRRSGRSR